MDKNQVLREAQKYAAKGLTDKALEEWNKYLSMCPGDGTAFNSVGDLYLKKRATAEAIDAFRKAAEIFTKEGFHLKAMAVYKKIITLDPSLVEIHVAMADLEGTRGFVASAREYLIKAADLCRSRGGIADSVSIYRKLVELEPANSAQRVRLADALIAAGKRDEGVHAYLEAAAGYGQDGKEEEAAAIYDKLSEIDPERPEVVIGSVRRLMRAGRADAAVETMKPLITPDLREPFLLSAYGEACLASGLAGQAVDALLRTLEADPHYTPARRMLGEALFATGQPERATAEIQTVLEDYRHTQDWGQVAEALKIWVAHTPSNPDIHQKLYEVYLKLGRPEDALRELKTVGSLYYDDGRLHKSLNVYEHVLREDPSDITVNLRVEEIRKKLADTGEMDTLPVKDHEVEGVSLADFQEEIVLANSDGVPFELESFDMDSRTPVAQAIMSSADEITLDLTEDRPQEISIDLSDSEIDLEAVRLEPDRTETSEEESPEAFGISFEMAPPQLDLDKPFVAPAVDNAPVASRSGIPAEVLAENMEEADFFMRQGLVDEARSIYEKILKLAPDYQDAADRLAILDKTVDKSDELDVLNEPPTLEPGGDFEVEGISLATPTDKTSWMEESGIAEAGLSRFMGIDGTEGGDEALLAELDEITFEGQAPDQAPVKSPTPWGDDEHLKEAFEDFKEGINRQIDAGDADTRYNLGIAYKEMGLLDEAVTEFEISARNPLHTLSSCTMLGLCYQDLGRADDAIAALKKGLGVPGLTENDRLALVYELARIYEKLGNNGEAMTRYENILEFDPNYRDASERATRLADRSGKGAEKKQRISYL